MTWHKGMSGNPKGRPVGTGAVEKLRASIATHVPDIIEAMVTAAKAGDTVAARLLLERTCPPLRAIDAPTVLDLPTAGGLAEQGRAVLVALTSGQLPVNQATAILQGLGNLAKLVELDELEKRVAALEGKQT